MTVQFERQRPASEAGWFWGIAQLHPDRTAVIDGDTSYTFGDLGKRVNKISNAIQARGLAAGDSITVALKNCADYLALELAAGQIGLYLVPTNVSQKAAEFAHVIGDSESKLVFVDAVSAGAAIPAARQCGLGTEDVIGLPDVDGTVSMQSFLESASEDAPGERHAGRYMYYTAGTTGTPKGVVVPPSLLTPEQDVDAWAPGFAESFGFVPFEGVHLITGPLYHRGPGIWAIVLLHLGHTMVLMRKFDPEDMLSLIEKHRITSSHIVPTVFHRMLQLPQEQRTSYDTSSLTHVLHAAAPCPVHVKQAMTDWLGDVMWEYYGSTEGGGTMVTPDAWQDHPGSVGRPWLNASVRITDELRNPVPAGTAGIIWISNGTTFRYRGDQAKTDEAWDGEWFTVGDIGHLDHDGWLYIGDRRSDLIISGGVNVYPAEVEGALLAHPAVGDVAVVGLPDEEWGQRVVAVVEPRPDHEAEDLSEDLRAHCREELARPKVPREFRFVAAMPRNEIGKVNRSALRETLIHTDEEKKQ